ncbi:MAG: ribonuclease E/G [Lachnospiraceae bacterium]|nr:ribonuclease E/G [Lachnospiraceae bacterium]
MMQGSKDIIKDIMEGKKKMDGKLVITREDNHIISAMFEEESLAELSVEPVEEKKLLGNIYTGKVKNIVRNINAAFVEVEKGLLCYYPLDINKEQIFLHPKKTSVLQEGDEILVQVSKEAMKTKAPSVTSNINLTGKYLVITAHNPSIGVSGKIEDSALRKHLKELVAPYKGESTGMIVRTNAQDAEDSAIIKEAIILEEQMEALLKKAPYMTCFSLVSKAPSGFIMDIRDLRQRNLNEILTDDTELYEEIKQYLMIYQPMDLKKLRFFEHTNSTLNQIYGINQKLKKALSERVWLKSGGYLIIQQTEAMVVIDVNTGKSIGKRKSQDHFLKINLEAAKEIARQLRLRNLSGIIIVDFIDMEKEESRHKLMKELESLFRNDRIKTTVIDMTKLNLIEITRKKVKKPLHEQAALLMKSSPDSQV